MDSVMFAVLWSHTCWLKHVFLGSDSHTEMIAYDTFATSLQSHKTLTNTVIYFDCANDPSRSAVLECKRANHSAAFASPDHGSDNYTAVLHQNSCNLFRFLSFSGWLCGFQLIVVIHWVWGIFKSDACHLARLEGDIRPLPFQNQMLRSVTLCSGQNCSGVLINIEPLTF